MIAEKTLELNIIAELLNIFRIIDQQCFFKGLTLAEEGIKGYDESLVSKQCLEILFFQFKAPKRKNTFWINNNRNKDQHNILFHLAARRKTVFYVFPLFHSDAEVHKSCPSLLNNTFFADVVDIGLLSQRWHKVKVDPKTSTAQIYSPPPSKKINLIRGKNIVRKAISGINVDEVCAISERLSHNGELRKEGKIFSKSMKTWGLFFKRKSKR